MKQLGFPEDPPESCLECGATDPLRCGADRVAREDGGWLRPRDRPPACLIALMPEIFAWPAGFGVHH